MFANELNWLSAPQLCIVSAIVHIMRRIRNQSVSRTQHINTDIFKQILLANQIVKSNWERTSVVKYIVVVIDQMAVRIVLNGWRFRCLRAVNWRRQDKW